ncbi:MAG: hypothetical protein ACFFA0_03730 [Promethearchaeota archaeon]
MNCKRYGKKLTNSESMERGYGRTCHRIVQMQELKSQFNTPKINQEIAFLKCEIKTLKKMLKNIHINSNNISIEPIERIRESHRPERNTNLNMVNMGCVVSELKELFSSVNDIHQILKPIMVEV